MIKINSYSKSKGKSSNASSSGNTSNVTIVRNDIPNVKIWGQDHDHTKDIDGDLTSQGTVTANTIVANNDVISPNATITNLESTTSNITNLSSNTVTSNTVTSNTVNADNGNIDQLFSSRMVTDYLQVLKKAHFTEIEVDEVTAVGGNLLLTAANAVLDKVTTNSTSYRCYWLKRDTDNTIDNQFKVGDQAICQTFDVVDGTTLNASNRYYWRLVVGVGIEETTIDGETQMCNYVDLSISDCDTDSDIPQRYDNIAQLGNRTDTSRQQAIILAAYNSMDANVTPPSITQYKGIDSYTLNGKIISTIGQSNNTFTGNFRVITGSTDVDVKDLISGNRLPNIVTDNEIAFYTADSNSKITSMSDAQNFPNTISVYIGGDAVAQSDILTSQSYIQYNGVRTILSSQPSAPTTNGVYLSAFNISGNTINLTWAYNGTSQQTVANDVISIVVAFTSGSETKVAKKNIPVQVIKNGTSIAGADAEVYEIQVIEYTAQVTPTDTLQVDFAADIKHIIGDQITTPTQAEMADFEAYMLLNNATSMAERKVITISSTGGMTLDFQIDDYSQLSDIPTAATVYLERNGIALDTVTTQIVFKAGGVFEVTDNAVNIAVQQANDYTSSESARWQLTANSISSRVTSIENDYVTSSNIQQTANEITLNITNNLKEKTGIDIVNGLITLNANKTVVNGQFTLANSEDGIVVLDENGNVAIQISNNEIGTFNDYSGNTTYVLNSYLTSSVTGYYAGSTDTKKIGYFHENDTITLSRTSALIYAERNSQITYPSASSAIITAIIKKQGQSTILGQFSLNGTLSGTTYTNTETKTFTIPSDGIYTITYTVSTSSSLPTSDAYDITTLVSQSITTKASRITILGKDGMLCNPSENSFLTALSDSIMMKFGNNALRVNEKGFQVLTDDLHDTWIPMSNYTPSYSVGNDRQYTRTYIPKASAYKYAYQINPVNDVGICVADQAFDGNNNKVDSWIILPETSWTDDNNITHSLPVGYTVHVINNSTSASKHNVFVTSINPMYDDSINEIRTSYDLDSTQGYNDKYVWMGVYWRAMRDTQ